MNERERLIELLMQGELEADKQGVFNCSRSEWKAEIMADFLLDNGVKCPLWKAIAKDAVEVVRCRDCRFSGSCSIEEFGCTEPDDYCSRGKRKEPDNG